MKLTDVIQHPQEAVDKIAELTARIGELEGVLRQTKDTMDLWQMEGSFQSETEYEVLNRIIEVLK